MAILIRLLMRAVLAAPIGIVIMHGKGGSPAQFVDDLALFRVLPANPLTRLYQPDSDHLGAPSASVDEIVRWTREVAGASRR